MYSCIKYAIYLERINIRRIALSYNPLIVYEVFVGAGKFFLRQVEIVNSQVVGLTLSISLFLSKCHNYLSVRDYSIKLLVQITLSVARRNYITMN